MDDGNQKQLEPDGAARASWEALPEGTPSKQSLPPAAGGITSFFGFFTDGLATFRSHRWLWAFLVAVTLIAVIITVLR